MENGIAREAWRTAVCAAAAQAREKYRSQEDTIDLAEQIVLAGDVQWHDDGAATVTSQSNPTTSYTVKGEKCNCQQATFRPHEYCKHTFATLIYRKAYKETTARVTEAVGQPTQPEAPARARAPSRLEEYIVTIKGKTSVRYVGLLLEAHAQGLISLEATLLSVTPDLATATATAIFANGKRFTECADASPGNVNAMVKGHYPRVALTRAKARALRDALGCELVALEELGEEDA